MMRRCVIVALCMMLSIAGRAQNYKLHSVYIYGFTRYVIWPDTYNQGDFEILVLGDTPLLEHLEQLAASKKVGERNIKVTKISSLAELRKCNILFIPATQSSQFQAVTGKIGSQPTLLITEETGLGAKGSDINFIMKDGKLAFELNQAAANKHNLKISNALLAMAILI